MDNNSSTSSAELSNEEYANKILEPKYKDLAEIDEKIAKAVYANKFSEILAVMEKYGDNKWWFRNDITMAYYQLHEPYLLVKFDDFQTQTEKLIGRPVYVHEFGLNIDSLRAEAEEAYNNPDSKKLAETAHERELDGLQTLTKANKDTIIIL